MLDQPAARSAVRTPLAGQAGAPTPDSDRVLTLDEIANNPLFAANQTGPALFEIGHAGG